METKEKVSILNDLVQINNDRIEGYERASGELKDSDSEIRAIFSNMAEESKTYKSDLIEKVRSLGGSPATDKTALGQIYHSWMDVKATFTGHDLKSILAACEFGEDAAQTAYKKALTETETDGDDIRSIISTQKASLKTSHDLIKHYRDRLD